MKKALIIIFVSLWIISCGTTQSPSLPIRISLYSVSIGLKNYEIPTDSISIKWYYPQDMQFSFKVVNLASDTTLLYFMENTIYDSDTVEYGRIRIGYQGEVYKLYARDVRAISAKDSSVFITWNISLPVFDSIYTDRQIAEFLKSLTTEATYFWVPNWDDYKNRPRPNGKHFTQLYEVFDKAGITLPDTIPITIDKDFFYYPMIDAQEIPLEQVGYPLETVPDSVKPPHPINGIPW